MRREFAWIGIALGVLAIGPGCGSERRRRPKRPPTPQQQSASGGTIRVTQVGSHAPLPRPTQRTPPGHVAMDLRSADLAGEVLPLFQRQAGVQIRYSGPSQQVTIRLSEPTPWRQAMDLICRFTQTRLIQGFDGKWVLHGQGGAQRRQRIIIRHAPPERRTEANPFLWVIEGRRPSFLFGSLGISDKRVSQLPTVVSQASLRCDSYHAGIRLDRESVERFGKLMSLPGGETVAHLLPPKVYGQVDDFLSTRRKGSVKDVRHLKVWGLSLLLPQIDQATRNRREGRRSRRNLPQDAFLYREAIRRSKNVDGLETLEELAATFDSYTKEEQVQLLEWSLEGLKRGDITRTISAYLRSDLTAIERLVSEAAADYEGLNEKIVEVRTQRSRRLASRIVERLRDASGQSHFVAVSVEHLVGEEGVLALLRAEGLRLRRLNGGDRIW